jgi:hypothetical protein
MTSTRLSLLTSYTRRSAAALIRHRSEVSVADLLRSAPDWYASQLRPSSPVTDRAPWMVFRATRFLDRFLRPDMRVFEYGVGGSTGFFLDHECQVVSVEHDEDWAETARREFGSRDAWCLHVKAPEPGAGADPSDPLAYGSRKYDAATFAQYVQVIDDYDPFDVVVVDGRARTAALRHAVDKVAPGGILILDDAERSRYRPGAALVDSRDWPRHDWFGPCPYSSYFSQTTAWMRPQRSSGR